MILEKGMIASLLGVVFPDDIYCIWIWNMEHMVWPQCIFVSHGSCGREKKKKKKETNKQTSYPSIQRKVLSVATLFRPSHTKRKPNSQSAGRRKKSSAIIEPNPAVYMHACEYLKGCAKCTPQVQRGVRERERERGKEGKGERE